MNIPPEIRRHMRTERAEEEAGAGSDADMGGCLLAAGLYLGVVAWYGLLVWLAWEAFWFCADLFAKALTLFGWN